MEEEIKKLAQRESKAGIAGFILVAAIGIYALYLRQTASVKPQLASKE